MKFSLKKWVIHVKNNINNQRVFNQQMDDCFIYNLIIKLKGILNTGFNFQSVSQTRNINKKKKRLAIYNVKFIRAFKRLIIIDFLE